MMIVVLRRDHASPSRWASSTTSTCTPAHAGYTYSDMNGYGHFLPRLRWFQVYYGALRRCCSPSLAYLFWVARHGRRGWRERVARGARSGSAAPVAARRRRGVARVRRARRLHLLQHERAEPLPHGDDAQKRCRPTTRRRTRRCAGAPQPKITASTSPSTSIPREQRVRMHGHYDARQPATAVPVDRRAPVLPRRASDSTCTTLGVRRRARRRPPSTSASGCAASRLATPLAPGATSRAGLRPRAPRRAASATAASTTDVVDNGTFVNGTSLLPDHRLRRARRALDRPRPHASTAWRPKERMRDRDDPTGSRMQLHHAATPTGSRSTPTVSTDADQIAIAPGLPAEASGPRAAAATSTTRWTRRSSTSSPCQSARYAVKRDRVERRRDRDLLPARATSTTSTG